MMKILQVTSKLFRGGAEAFIMNVYRNIDRKEYQFDFLVFHSSREYYEDEIESMGGRIFHVPIMDGCNFLFRRPMLDKFFSDHSCYDAVHCHMAALGGECLASAERHGIKIRLSHSHIADYERNSRGRLKRLFEKGFGSHATTRLACSMAAGQYMYGGSPFLVVKNGIDTDRFVFNKKKRSMFRASLGVAEDECLVGHVGRFELMKNHAFLIEIFASMIRSGFHGRLVLAGDGSLREGIEERAHTLGIDSSVVFLGVIDDMPSFYSGVDIFVMPSLFEGLPYSAIEAQCSGLPCVLSDSISSECKVSDAVTFLPLDAGAERWAESIALKTLDSKLDARDNAVASIIETGYDIKEVASLLESQYGGGQ